MRSLTSIVSALVAVLGVSAGAAAQAPLLQARVPPPVFADAQRATTLAGAFPEIDRVVASFGERARVPGVALGVVIDGVLVHVTTQGVQDIDTRAPVTADTVFRIASMTKSFTAVAILQLRDAGKLSLEDAVEKYIPELRGLTPATTDAPTITIRHLLSHSEGLPEDNPWGDRQLARSDAWMAEALRAGLPFSTVPGTAYEYSNYGFAILGRIVQVVSGEPYDRYVQRMILAPLGMTSSTFDVTAVPVAVRAQGYRRDGSGHAREDLLAHGAFGAMGGLWTSTRDLARYVAFQMSAWPARDGDEHPVLRRASLREMQQVTRHTSTVAQRSSLDTALVIGAGGYGYGLRVSDDCLVGNAVGHGGGLPGYGSLMRWLPERGVGLVAMGNLTYTGWGGVFNDALAALRATGALNARVVQPSPRLVEMRDAVTRLVTGPWDDALAEQVAADNLWLDSPVAERRARFATLAERHGACRDVSRFEVENALRGRWRVTCERGWLDVGITLAPTMPARVQQLDVRGVMPPGPELQRVITQVLSLMGTWNDAEASALFAPAVDRARVARLLQLARLQGGTCTVGDTRVGDGTRALFELRCDRAPLVADVVLDRASGRVSFVNVLPDPQQSCAP